MNNTNSDIYEMLDTLSLPVAAQRFSELTQSPELVNYTAFQFIREVLEPQYTETLNRRFETNLRLSSLINKGVLNRQKDLNRYRKRIKYYARIQLLFIDDFAISRYSEEGIKILYHLLKLRDDLGTSTLFSCQYSPDEWGKQLSDENECYGKLDGIRRRLTTGFTVLIEKA